jgi:hypothetical protein
MTYPSGPNPNPYGDQQSQSSYPYPPAAGGMSQPMPPYAQPGYPPQPQPEYPQGGYAPQGAYGQPGYPSQAGYAQPQYPQAGYPQQPPAQYAPYGAPQPGYPGAAPQAKAKAKNTMAVTALAYGGISFVVNLIGLFVGFYLTGIFAVFALYYGIRAIVRSMKLPGNAGIGMAIGGIVLSVLSLGITVLGYASVAGK